MTHNPQTLALLVAVVLTVALVAVVVLVPDPTPSARLVEILEAVNPQTLRLNPGTAYGGSR